MSIPRGSLRAGFAAGLMFSLAFAYLILPVQAQTTNGSLAGTVTYPSGGVIPGAAITLANLGTSERRTTATDPDCA